MVVEVADVLEGRLGAAALGPVLAAGAGLLPELDEPGLKTRSRLGDGLVVETGDRIPGVRPVRDAPPTIDCLDVGAEGFLGLSARGANDCRDVRADTAGGTILCRRAAGVVGGGAIEARFPAAVPLMLCRGALAAEVVDDILDGRGFATGAAGLPFAGFGAGFGCSKTNIVGEGCMNKPC